jgi:hypothetical protein
MRRKREQNKMRRSFQAIQTPSQEPGQYPADLPSAKGFRKRILGWRLVAALVFFLSVALFTSFAFTPSASAATLSPKDVVYGQKWVTTGSSYTGTSVGNWKSCGYAVASPNPSHVTCSGTFSFSATVSGSVQVGYGGLSGQVGFNVTKTTTFGVSYTVDIPAHVNVTIQIGAKWYDYRVAQRECSYLVRTGACISWISSTVYATVRRYDTRAFRNIDS